MTRVDRIWVFAWAVTAIPIAVHFYASIILHDLLLGERIGITW